MFLILYFHFVIEYRLLLLILGLHFLVPLKSENASYAPASGSAYNIYLCCYAICANGANLFTVFFFRNNRKKVGPVSVLGRAC